MTRDRHLRKDKQIFLDTLKKRGITDQRVLNAMKSVPREAFVGSEQVEFAYDDCPLQIEEGQTISQPYIVALMTEAMQVGPEDTVLEIGTGSGYAAAVLSRIVKRVYTIERHQLLADLSQERLEKQGYDNVAVLCGDGTRGWPEHAPFDAIVVTAGAPEVPQPLISQLATGGRLIIPVDSGLHQQLLRVTRIGEEETESEKLGGVRFVPLISEKG